MGQIASLVLGFGVNTAGLTSGLKGAADKVDGFFGKFNGLAKAASGAFGGVVKGLGSVGVAAAGVAAGVAAVELAKTAFDAAYSATVGATIAGLDRIDQLGDAAQRLGTTTKALSELRYAANLTGSSAEDLDAALTKMNANLGDSTTQATPASTALARLGLDAKALAREDPSEAFKKIVDGFGKVPDAATKASLAMDIFGKGGVKILNTLSASSGDLEKLAEEARKLGVSIDAVDQAKVAAAKDALDRAGAAMEGVGNQLAVKLAPYIEAGANAFADFAAGVMEGGSGVEKVLDGIISGVAWIADGAAMIQSKFTGAFATIAEGAAKVARFLGLQSDTIEAIASDLRKLADDQSNNKPGQAIQNFYDGIKAKANEAAQAVAKLGQANKKTNDGMAAVATSVGTLNEKLREQVATFGMSASEAEIYQLAQKGATAEQLAQAKALSAQLKGLEDSKKAQDDLASFAKGLKDKALSPLEKYREQLGKIRQAFDQGLIDKSTFDRSTAAAKKEAGGSEAPKFAAALDVNSKEGYSAILAATQGRSDGGMRKIAERQAALQADGNGTLKSILSALTFNFTAPVEMAI